MINQQHIERLLTSKVTGATLVQTFELIAQVAALQGSQVASLTLNWVSPDDLPSDGLIPSLTFTLTPSGQGTTANESQTTDT